MTQTPPPVVRALERAAMYRMFSMAFQAPTEARLQSLGALDEASRPIEELRRDGTTVSSLAAQYCRVFGHTARGLVCGCETEYGDDNKYQQPQQLADIAGYYLAFGLTPVSATELRHDHVACECEFMAFLNLKQALFMEECAHTDGGAETLDVTRRAERMFLRDHLGPFGLAFASTLAGDQSHPYYSAWGTLFLDWLERQHQRFALEVATTPMPLRTGFSDDAPMACGSASELIQILRR